MSIIVEDGVMHTIRVDADRSEHRKLMPPTHAGAGGAVLDAVDMAVLGGFEEMQAEGEPDLIVELIDLYLEDAPRKVASMLEAVAETDEGALRRAAHSLKGSSASLGVGQVAALCEEVERAGCDGSFERAGALLDRMARELARARLAFAAERRKRL